MSWPTIDGAPSSVPHIVYAFAGVLGVIFNEKCTPDGRAEPSWMALIMRRFDGKAAEATVSSPPKSEANKLRHECTCVGLA